MRSRFPRLVLTPVLLAGVLGCSGDGLPPAVPVKVKVTFRTKPANGARVSFFPKDEMAFGGALPMGKVGADGVCVPTTYTQNDGMPEGAYKAIVVWSKTIHGVGEPREGPDLFGGRYANKDTSGLTATVHKPSGSEPQQITLDLK